MTSTRFLVFFVAAVAVGLLALSVRFLGSDGGSCEGPDGTRARPVENETSGLAGTVAVIPETGSKGPGDLTLLSGETSEVRADALPADRAVALDLRLGEPSTTSDPLVGRILSEGRAPRDLSAAILGEDRRTARVEIGAGSLSPGRYVIEVRTTERTHFPLRRYALEVR